MTTRLDWKMVVGDILIQPGVCDLLSLALSGMVSKLEDEVWTGRPWKETLILVSMESSITATHNGYGPSKNGAGTVLVITSRELGFTIFTYVSNKLPRSVKDSYVTHLI